MKNLSLNKNELAKIEIEKTKKGFTIWIKDGNARFWILDGSCIKQDGTIRLGIGGGFGICNYKATYQRQLNEIKLVKRSNLTTK